MPPGARMKEIPLTPAQRWWRYDGEHSSRRSARKGGIMKRQHRLLAAAPLALALIFGAGLAGMPALQPEDSAHEMPMLPPPGEQHEWLQQMVGTWSIESKMTPPGQDPIKCTGTETVRSLGGRWTIGELSIEIPGMGAMRAVITLGYDPQAGRYQGTWVDSITDHMWVYDGTLDPTGKILTLEADGPNMMDPAGGMARYRDVIEIRSESHYTLTSYTCVDGKWVQFGSANYRRQK
ncbi:MAG: DUF1579 domain-containing protein [Cyanobacteria bacterium CYA]|nr:MAG: DUF1579 domain-containing protein [Cyanobacteria bacterium CYA]